MYYLSCLGVVDGVAGEEFALESDSVLTNFYRDSFIAGIVVEIGQAVRYSELVTEQQTAQGLESTLRILRILSYKFIPC